MDKTKVVKILLVFFHYILPLAAIGYIIYTLISIPRAQLSFWKEMLDWSIDSLFLLFSVMMLTVLNWLLEAMKWQKLAYRFEELSLRKAYGGVLYGISLGMITPRRAGEFVGRAVVLSPENRVRGIAINTAGSYSQLLVTLLFGHAGVALAILGRTSSLEPFREGKFLLFSGIVLLIMIFFGLYARRIFSWLRQKAWFSQRLKIVEVFSTLTRREMGFLIFFSMLRYAVFIIQFHLLLGVLGIELLFRETFMVLGIIYLIMVGIPVSGLAEVGIRGSVALFVFSLYLGEKMMGFPAAELTIVSASLMLWFFNLALPGLLGASLSISGKLKTVSNS